MSDDIRKHLDEIEQEPRKYTATEFHQAMDLLRESEARARELVEALKLADAKLRNHKYGDNRNALELSKIEAAIAKAESRWTGAQGEAKR